MTALDWTALPVIISTRDLADAPRGTVIADVRWDLHAGSGREDYRAEHIPGAIYVDLEHDLTGEGAPEEGRHPFPTDDDFGETLGRLGIEFETTVIAYSQNDPMAAARFVVMLRLSGVNAAVLDGGLDAWKREGGAVESGENTPNEVYFGTQPFVRLVGIDEVSHAIPTRGAVLVDARDSERFEGGADARDPRPGHIPGAQNLPYRELLRSDFTFRTPGEISEAFAARGVTQPRITFNYCGSGVSAAVNLLAMDLAGFEHAYLYPGSYSQWSRDSAREIETGPARPQ